MKKKIGATKFIYFFGEGKAEGSAAMKAELGGKGAGLAEMSKIGIPVPAGFTISTEVCHYYEHNDKKYPKGLEEEIEKNLKKLEEVTGKKFGLGGGAPLLVSVRSGAAVSMPGMMDTILNLGINDEVVEIIARKTDNARFAMDVYRRFLQMYGEVVEGIEQKKFEYVIDKAKEEKGVKDDQELTAIDWQKIIIKFKEIYKIEKGKDFPSDPREQLKGAIEAVMRSWQNERAIVYRKLNKIDDKKIWGTAVNIQSMVFGNMGSDCGTGVAFTRDPNTGAKEAYGEYLMNAQGEDVVAGIRTPKLLTALKEDNEKIYEELLAIFKKLEKHYREVQDVEFTIENGKLFILQTRSAKRTAAAMVKVLVDMVEEKLITDKEALSRVEPEKIEQLLHPRLQAGAKKDFKLVVKGMPASPGAVSGKVVLTAAEAVKQKENGEKVVLVRMETSPEDIAGMNAAEAILTARGGMTSHAAVVARGMGKCCVVGAEGMVVSPEAGLIKVGEMIVRTGEVITVDGSSGEVYLGKVPTEAAVVSGDLDVVLTWADKYRKLGVRTNADTPKDAKVARELGAEGIGLCRTEHMFFAEDRIFAVRQMILANDKEQREAALKKIFPMQKNDFKQLFEIMKGKPVKIRLLDPPLHEFLPKKKEEIEALAAEMEVPEERLKERIEFLAEFNPMMGHRGCRLGITFPEIFEMQVRAIIAAAAEVKSTPDPSFDGKEGSLGQLTPEIMIPLVGEVEELKWLKKRLIKVIEETIKEYGDEQANGLSVLGYELGTMIEIPRAAVTADEIAAEADFFSFGTNDLTQMTYGFSRDDAGKFLKDYIEEKILPEDPFKTLDQKGVGKLMEMAVKLGRGVKKKLHIGICGEQGGDPETIYFCHKIGLDYVSCSPYRVPIARLAAGRAAVREMD